MKKPKTKLKPKPPLKPLTRRDSHVKREKHARDALVKLPPPAQIEQMPNEIHPLLYNLLVPLANGGFIPASRTTTAITGKRDRRLAMTPYEVFMIPPPSAQPFRHDEDGDGDINIEDNIQEGDHDELDLEPIETWEHNNPRQEKHKFTPTRTTKIISVYMGDAQQQTPVQSAKYNPEHISRLQSLLWQRGMTANFDFQQITLTPTFSGTVSFAGETVHSEGSGFTSKKLVKENLSKLAIPIVETLGDQAADDKVSDQVLDSANWAGSLQNYTQAYKLPMPDFTEFRTPYTPHLFSCSVRLASSLAIFGSETTLYPNKSTAKKAAAREAVLWVRSQGFDFPEAQVTGGPSTPSMKKQKGFPASPGPGMTGLTQVLQEYDINKFAHLSLPQQLHESVVMMGFSQPEMKSQPSCNGSYGSSIVDLWAQFSELDVQKEPKLAGRVGMVEKVFGRKQAKEQCCKEVLQFLEELRRSRSG
ncbi:hypothetical protein LTR15_000658 [Elasticomyces elasticus]|nr:hypothetical protein LTR15_000658 [Elasticomyces elasticus]